MLPLRRDTVPRRVPAHFLGAGDWGLLAGQRAHTPLQHSPTWKPCSQINGASVAINCHQGKCRHLSGTLFTGLGNEEAGGKRSLFHSLILKRMNEMAGAFNFFTGDLKEPNVCSTALQVLSFSGRVARARALSLRGEVSSICLPVSSLRRRRSDELIHHCSFAPAQLHHSHNYLSSRPGSAHAGAWVPRSSPPRRGVQVSGSDKAGPAMVSLGRTHKRVARPAPAHLFPLDSLHKKSCRKSI